MIPLLPPGSTERVDAASALVIAPHYDDEVLGCGGLVAQLTRAGAQVGVLFLSDGAATAEQSERSSDHAALRREESEAAGRVLGLSYREHLGLPDGQLAARLEELAIGIARALAHRQPQLVLVPSPLEVTADHRAAFAALHRVLAPLREPLPSSNPQPLSEPQVSFGPQALAELASRISILAYEVNRPLFPNLLVDVSTELPTLEAAMACYESQEERHGYLRARLGLSRYRTLSLAPEVEAAEGYVRLTAADFSTRSLAQLVAHLGGVPERLAVHDGPKISVVVRTKDRPELLAEALASLAAGSYRRVEVVLVNDGGEPPGVPEGYPLPVVRLDLAENRGRAAAAQAGVEAASGDYIAFLDDDDLAAPEHLATLARLVSAAGVRVAYTDAAVGIYELDDEEGWRAVERRLPYSRDFDRELLLLDNYIPFNTLLIERGLFAEIGPFDDQLPFFEDWDVLIRLAARTSFHHLPQVTCEYRHFRGAGHHVLGAAAQGRAGFLAMKAKVLAKHAGELSPALLASAVDRLRGEIVNLGEERSMARGAAKASEQEALRLRREKSELEGRFHRTHGELKALEGDAARLRAELEASGREIARLFGEEQRLTTDSQRLEGDLRSQTELVGRLYAEIERLGKQITTMETTRAWRFHQWWQRRR